jgi:hypothetical protein
MNLGSTKVSRLIKQYDLKLARTSVSDILIKVGGEMKEKDGEQDRTDADAEENN